MNRLLQTIAKSLNQLVRAIKGEVIMSEELEDVYQSILEQRIPSLWKVCCYDIRDKLMLFTYACIL